MPWLCILDVSLLFLSAVCVYDLLIYNIQLQAVLVSSACVYDVRIVCGV